jgi:hypothetical protein
MLLSVLPAPSAWAGPSEKDLVPYVERAMHGYMVKCPEPVPGHPGILRTTFGCTALPVPQVGHADWDWGDLTGRAVQAWLFAREVTGDEAFGRDVEEGQRAALLWLLTPEFGMPCVPDRSDPAKGLYHYQMWDQGRTLRALVRWWLAEGDSARKRDLRLRTDRMVASLNSLSTHGSDPHFGPYAVFPWDYREGDRSGDDLYCMRGGQLVEPLALYYAATGDEKALRFARELTAGVISGHEADTYEGATKRLFAYGENGSFRGHFHDHASIALGVARLGRALWERGRVDEGRRLLLWAKRVYDWTIAPANANAGSTWGWFPENVGSDNTQAREICEICCTADMIEFAAVLAEASTLDPEFAGWDALWDHVERYTLNAVVPAQFSVTPAYRRLLRAAAANTASVRNGYVEFSTDANGCLNHEVAGGQTLRVADGGHLSQFAYGIRYAGGGAWFEYRGGLPIQSHGFTTQQPCRRDEGGAIRGAVRTEDGALEIGLSARCGEGPSVVYTFAVRNLTSKPVAGVRFGAAANLDFTDYTTNVAAVDPETGWITVRSRSHPGVVGMCGEPRADFSTTGDVFALLGDLAVLKPGSPTTSAEGNVAGELAWDLGTLGPGEARSVSVVFAAAGSAEEAAKALRQERFEDRPPGSRDAAGLAVAARMEGAFVAAFVPNDLAFAGGDGRPYTNMMGCCFPAGVRALYTCWKAALFDDGTTLSARLPMDRVAPCGRQDVTERSGAVTQVIRLTSRRRVRVRIPDWASLESVEVRDGAGRRLAVAPRGRWIDCGIVGAGRSVRVSYPLIARRTREKVGGSLESLGFSPADRKTAYIADWQGNTVVRLEPPGRLLPVFGR